MNQVKSIKLIARQAKTRVKTGFWQEYEETVEDKMEKVKELGLSESKASQYFKVRLTSLLSGEAEDEFYLKVKAMLLQYGEVSDAIGRLTDQEYYATLTYEEKQRYTLDLSQKYLRALERFRNEYEFESIV